MNYCLQCNCSESSR